MKVIQLIMIAGLFLFTATFATAQTSSATAAETPQTITTEKTIKVKVKGVGCSRDCKAIADNVAGLDGVSACETLKKGATTTFSVTYNASIATEKMIYAAVENTPGCSKQAARPYKVKLK